MNKPSDNDNYLTALPKGADLLAFVKRNMEHGGENNYDQLLQIARKPNLAPEVYQVLAKGSFYIRAALADNHWVPTDVLDELNDDTYYAIQSRLAKNPNISPATMLHIADVRQAAQSLLDNPNLTPEAFERLVLSPNVRNTTKWFAIDHPLMTKGLLFNLVRSNDPDTKEKARQRLREI